MQQQLHCRAATLPHCYIVHCHCQQKRSCNVAIVHCHMLHCNALPHCSSSFLPHLACSSSTCSLLLYLYLYLYLCLYLYFPTWHAAPQPAPCLAHPPGSQKLGHLSFSLKVVSWKTSLFKKSSLLQSPKWLQRIMSTTCVLRFLSISKLPMTTCSGFR